MVLVNPLEVSPAIQAARKRLSLADAVMRYHQPEKVASNKVLPQPKWFQNRQLTWKQRPGSAANINVLRNQVTPSRSRKGNKTLIFKSGSLKSKANDVELNKFQKNPNVGSTGQLQSMPHVMNSDQSKQTRFTSNCMHSNPSKQRQSASPAKECQAFNSAMSTLNFQCPPEFNHANHTLADGIFSSQTFFTNPNMNDNFQAMKKTKGNERITGSPRAALGVNYSHQSR